MKRTQSRCKSRRSRQSRQSRRSRRSRRSRQSGGTSMVVVAVGKLFSNNCGHCTAMETAWAELKLMHPTLITDETDIEASEMKGPKRTDLKAKYNVDINVDEGYPTIYKIIKSPTGEHSVVFYKSGDRTTKAMDVWIKAK